MQILVTKKSGVVLYICKLTLVRVCRSASNAAPDYMSPSQTTDSGRRGDFDIGPWATD